MTLRGDAILDRLRTEAQLAENAGDKPILTRSFNLAIEEIERLRAAMRYAGHSLELGRVGATVARELCEALNEQPARPMGGWPPGENPEQER